MIIYPLDVAEPYQIVMLLNDYRCSVRGRSKIIRTNKDGEFQGAEFGGADGIWNVKLSSLLTKGQKRTLRYIRRIDGKKAEQKMFKELIAAVIAGHSKSIAS